MRIEVVPYDPRWPPAFERLRSQLAEALSKVGVLGIEHVGSTAVPGLAAKPVIDVDVVVTEHQIDAAIGALESIGYTHRGDLGILDRHAFAAPEGDPRRNVYVVVDGCLALRNHLGVRDVLRADDDLRDRYGDLKLTLAGRRYENVDQYGAAKSGLLQEVLERAGLDAGQRAAIDAVNQPAEQREPRTQG